MSKNHSQFFNLSLNGLLMLLIVSLITISGCRRERGCTDISAVNFDAGAAVDDGSCFYTGRVSFWTDGDGTCGNIDVWVDGEFIGTLAEYFPSGFPECGQVPGTISVDLPPGTYPYNAVDDCGTWDNFVTVTSDGCLVQKLAQ